MVTAGVLGDHAQKQEVDMLTLHVPVWDLLWRGTALCLAAAFVVRGHILKRRLRDSAARAQRSRARP
jgi:hypothetical protein